MGGQLRIFVNIAESTLNKWRAMVRLVSSMEFSDYYRIAKNDKQKEINEWIEKGNYSKIK